MGVHLKGGVPCDAACVCEDEGAGVWRVVLTSSAAGCTVILVRRTTVRRRWIGGADEHAEAGGEKHNIKVNTVVPIAGTRLTEGVLPPEIFERLKPEFVAPLVLYLSSEQCL